MNKIVTVLFLMSILVGCDGVARSGPIRHVSLVEAKGLLAKSPQSFTILDLRTPDEFMAGHLKKAVNENYYNSGFKDELNKLDKETPYLIYCQSGTRGSKALKIMEKMGFKKVFHLYGGYQAWTAKSLPIVKSLVKEEKVS